MIGIGAGLDGFGRTPSMNEYCKRQRRRDLSDSTDPDERQRDLNADCLGPILRIGLSHRSYQTRAANASRVIPVSVSIARRVLGRPHVLRIASSANTHKL
jgi:hypothetical protein